MGKILFFILSSFIIACGSEAENNETLLSKEQIEVPLQGNTYATVGSNKIIDYSNGSLKNNQWTDPKTVISTYFRVSTSGDLNLSLKYSADTESKIKISCGNKSFEVKCPKATNQTIPVGKFTKVDIGYVKVSFQGIDKKGSSFPNIASLLVGGKATEGKMYYVNTPDFYYWGRRGPSVHMGYTLPEGNTEWFYNEVTVPEGYDHVGSYFMANGFGEGYFGMQVNSETERRILFSVWSPFSTDNPNEIPNDELILLNKKGENVISQAFGGEGSGRQNIMKYSWKAGTTYKFLLHCRPDPVKSNYTEYAAYFYSPTDGWLLVASNSRPKISTYCTRPHSFLENFDPQVGHITRKVYFGNQWAYVVGQGWREITQGKFTYDNTANQKQRIDYKGGAEGNRFFLQNCGFFSDYTEGKMPFTRTGQGVAPIINFDKLP